MPTTEGQDEYCQFVQIQNRTCSVFTYIILFAGTAELIFTKISITSLIHIT